MCSALNFLRKEEILLKPKHQELQCSYQKSKRPTLKLVWRWYFFSQRYILKHTHVSNDKLKFGTTWRATGSWEPANSQAVLRLSWDGFLWIPRRSWKRHRLQCTGHLYSSDMWASLLGMCSGDNPSFDIIAMTAVMCANTRDGWLV